MENPKTIKSSNEKLDENFIKNDHFPKSIFFIIGNEFCERFCYYGLRAILTLFFINVLNYSENEAINAFHLFAMFCYITPILGAFIADSYLGKYKTILYLSIVYIGGNVLLSSATITSSEWMSIFGLGLIALGTGGVKPCVSAFGGDQFKTNQRHLLNKYFSFFYLSINLGSLLSMVVTPIFRKDIQCFGQESCYLLAFGVPGILLIISLILFVAGSSLYLKANCTKENVAFQFISCIMYSLYKKICSMFKSSCKKSHFLDYAIGKYQNQLIQDSKDVLSVFLLFLPLPIFWCLFDQQGSRWVIQAELTDGSLGFINYTMKSDQFQVINPLLIVFLIPFFQYIIYPALAKFNLLVKPLQKMSFGGLLAALSFVCAGILQFYIIQNQPKLPNLNECNLNLVFLTSTQNQELIFNTMKLNLNNENIMKELHEKNLYTQNKQFVDLGLIKSSIYELELNLENKINLKKQLELSGSLFYTLIISERNNTFEFNLLENRIKKNLDKFQIEFYLNLKPTNRFKEYVFELEFKLLNKTKMIFILKENNFTIPFIELNEAHDDYSLFINGKFVQNIDYKEGRIYRMMITNYGETNFNIEYDYLWLNFKKISMFWQSIQYVLITISEIMFSVTGLEFSYSQAPKSMKSVVTAVWLFTTASGNFLVVLITKFIQFESQAMEFFFFALIMAGDLLIFMVLAYYYKPRKIEQDSQLMDISERKNENL